jgi:tetratricopeptide (TPR) repeat protein
MEIIIPWIILSFIIAFIGSDRKIGYGGTLLLSLLLSPIIGAIFALASPRITETSKYAYSPEAIRLSNIASKEYKKGNYSKAIELLEQALALSPKSAILYYNLAIYYSVLQDEEKVYSYLEKAVSNGFDDFKRIQTHERLSIIRSNPKFKEFVENGYKLPAKKVELRDSSERISQLEKLAELKEKGILTNNEFEAEKLKILSKS